MAAMGASGLKLAAMLVSDLVRGCTRYGMVNLVASQPVVYACVFATAALGQFINDRGSALLENRATWMRESASSV